MMAYVQAGPDDGEPVLLLHGEPGWSFLYRTIMPVLAGAGHFLQEDAGEQLAAEIVAFVAAHPAG